MPPIYRILILFAVSVIATVAFYLYAPLGEHLSLLYTSSINDLIKNDTNMAQITIAKLGLFFFIFLVSINGFLLLILFNIYNDRKNKNSME